jgi:chaperone required for assembly of F1-ATPase
MKRFYKEVSVSFTSPLVGEVAAAARSGATAGEGYSILLDGRTIKTPKRASLAVPTQTLAEAVAEEWRSQGEEIRPPFMHLTKLANTAIDRVRGREAETADQIAAYANDLLCYRAEAPEDLAARQAEAWDPLLDWAAEHTGARLNTGTGVGYIVQPEETLAALHRAVSAYDAFQLAALHNAATILGSLVLTLALAESRLDAETAFALSQIDERYQAEKWGADPEASARTGALAAELSAAARFLRLLT